MDKGLWVWPTDPKGQRRILRGIAGSRHLMTALQGIAKSKDGMNNSEIDELLADNSIWMTIWAVRQLTALGFIEYKVDLFGGPARYVATELGKSAFSTLTEQAPTSKQPSAAPPPTQPVPRKSP